MQTARKSHEGARGSDPRSEHSNRTIEKIGDETPQRGYSDELAAYMARFRPYPALKDDADYAFLFEAYAGQDEVKSQRARDLIVYGNIRLVLKFAFPLTGRGLPLLDLLQEGCIGLMKAVEKFEPSKGWRFSTYASNWIRQAMTRALYDRNERDTYRIPIHYRELMQHTRRACAELYLAKGRWPKELEVYEWIKARGAKIAEKLTLADVVNLMRRIKEGKADVRLDAPAIGKCGEMEDETVGDRLFLGPPKTETIVEARRLCAEYYGALERIEAAVNELPPRTAQVVRLRLGLGDFEAMSLEEIGERYELTRERIRQIEAEAYNGRKGSFEGLETKLGITRDQIVEIADITQDLEVVAHAL